MENPEKFCINKSSSNSIVIYKNNLTHAFFRIYESKDYLWNKVVVFHSLFLSTCEKRQSIKSACIGHYVLPPVSVQEGEYCFVYGSHNLVVTNLGWELQSDPRIILRGYKMIKLTNLIKQEKDYADVLTF